MNLAMLLVKFLAVAFYLWLTYIFFQISFACWRPAGAKDSWVSLVTARERQFFSFFKWSSPVLLVAAVLQLLVLILLFVRELLHVFAS